MDRVSPLALGTSVRSFNFRRVAALGALLAFAPLVGCGSGSPTPLIGVTGSITLDGAPVSKGTITFMPVGTTGQTASSSIENGAYEMGTYDAGDGVPPGEYKVAIQSYTVEPSMENPAGTPAVPAKYLDAGTSGLTASVEDGGDVTIDFPLTK